MAAPKQNLHKQDASEEILSCFVVMPISDVEPYAPGHFRRVYDHLIKPACNKAGFSPILASDVKETNLIVLDILERLHNSEMVLCDLSSRNPNVLYELGFRQAFNRPVTLIKDLVTERIFDIAGLRDIPYDHNLRVDTAQSAIEEIAKRLEATYQSWKSGGGGVNSLVQLLSVDPATVPKRQEVSQDTRVILDALENLGDRISAIELRGRSAQRSSMRTIGKEVNTLSARLHILIRISPPGVAKRRRAIETLASIFPRATFSYTMAEEATEHEVMRASLSLSDEFSYASVKSKLLDISFPEGIEIQEFYLDLGGAV